MSVLFLGAPKSLHPLEEDKATHSGIVAWEIPWTEEPYGLQSIASQRVGHDYSIFKSRDITLPAKVHLVKAMVFPVVMYGCKSWTVKKSEH